MAERLLPLTRVDLVVDGSPVLVNLDNVAWIEPDDDDMTRVVFAVGLHKERANGPPLAIRVRESLAEIARRASMAGSTDYEAIAQAWADQSAQRQDASD
jgi:hypothetical protein